MNLDLLHCIGRFFFSSQACTHRCLQTLGNPLKKKQNGAKVLCVLFLYTFLTLASDHSFILFRNCLRASLILERICETNIFKTAKSCHMSLFTWLSIDVTGGSWIISQLMLQTVLIRMINVLKS